MMMRMHHGWTTATLAVTVGACAGADAGPSPWNPGPFATSEATPGSTGGAMSTSRGDEPGDEPGDTTSRPSDDTTGGAGVCTPGEVIDCLCDDGREGEAECEPTGRGFDPCVCEGDDSTGTDGGESSDSSGDVPVGEEVCYPGPLNDFTTCFPLHLFDPMPDGYDYPPPFEDNDNYRAPIALIDLQQIDPNTFIAPNFQLVEIAQAKKGRYAVVQPHAIAAIQVLRDQVGPIVVNSGYRSPAYNAGVPGSAMFSRHMYGDAFDLDPIASDLATLEGLCTDEGGMLVEYETHVHCDFRFDPVDEQFFGPPNVALEEESPDFGATLVQGDDGQWSAPAVGFDEGTPQRRWVARDEAGEVLATAVAERFTAPAGTAVVEVRVGAQVERSVELPTAD